MEPVFIKTQAQVILLLTLKNITALPVLESTKTERRSKNTVWIWTEALHFLKLSFELQHSRIDDCVIVAKCQEGLVYKAPPE